jgi:transposase InsO family protein
VNRLTEKTEVPVVNFVDWLGITRSKFYGWRARYGKANEHNGKVPRDHWVELWEREAIITYFDQHPLEGYRRLTFMMLDDDIVAVSPSTVYRVLRAAGRLDRHRPKPSTKGTGFVQPFGPHMHWHVDLAVITIAGTYYYLCSVLDGYSRAVVAWDFADRMTEADVELILQRALEAHPGARPRVISDNGPQFIAGDFRRFIDLTGLTHVRTSVNYPQSNGKIERYHRTLDKGTIHALTPDGARATIAARIDHYNTRRLHSAIGYVSPRDKLLGQETEIWAERDRKLEQARELRRKRRELDHLGAAA